MNSQVSAQKTPLAWRNALLALLLLLVCIVVVYRDTAIAMVTIWYRSETFTHGFVVLPITLWLIWRRRRALALMTPRPNGLFLLVFAGLALMWMLGDMVAVNSVTQLAFVAMLVAAVPAVLGLSVAASIAFPLAFMFFAVPIGEFVMPQLMDWTADFTIFALRLSGIPVFREGNSFVIPTGSWSVVEACSGVRYLIASLMVGTLYAYLNYQSLRRRLLFILIAILVPIVANWLRAYMIVMLGHLSGNTIAVGVDHLVYGWVFFGVVILLMFMIGARWSEPELETAVETRHPVAAAGASAVNGRRFWLLAIGCAAVMAWPSIARIALHTPFAATQPQLALGEDAMLPWQVSDTGAIAYKPHFEAPSAEMNQVYTLSGRSIGVYLGYYRDQDYDRKLVSSSNQLITSRDRVWVRLSEGTHDVRIGDQSTAVRVARLRRISGFDISASETLLVWKIYWINGHWTSNDYLAKIYSAPLVGMMMKQRQPCSRSPQPSSMRSTKRCARRRKPAERRVRPDEKAIDGG